jgi:hypothetical protein
VGDPNVIPEVYGQAAPDARVQPPFTVPFARGGKTLTVGWAISLGAAATR